MSLDCDDLERIREVVDLAVSRTVTPLVDRIADVETKQKVSEVYVKNLYKAIDWKGWIALITVFMGVISMWRLK